METELKTAIWKIANAAIEMHEDKLNGKEFEELAMDALRQVKNLNIPCVIKSVCPRCGENESFRTDGKKMQCASCGKWWRQTVL